MKNEAPFQLASEPATNIIVSAHAGSGKTHTLVTRILRLLLNGTEPEKILCVTFTKAAASEMKSRVLEVLSTWLTLRPKKLDDALLRIGEDPNTISHKRVRSLFARVLETPGGLKIQTIHAFCEQLLQRFPLETGISPGFSILDEAQAHGVLHQKCEEIIETHRDENILAFSKKVLTYASKKDLQILLKELRTSSFPLLSQQNSALIQDNLAKTLGISLDKKPEIPSEPQIVDNLKACKNALLSCPGTLNDAQASLIEELLNKSALPPVWFKLFFTTTGAPKAKSRLMTKKCADRAPDCFDFLSRHQNLWQEYRTHCIAWELFEATWAFLNIASLILRAYAEHKKKTGKLDYHDLITLTLSLFHGYGADFVLYKLDASLEHVLVDEAQDTSPQQWEILGFLIQEFFSGHGRHGETQRTFFAVGDPKQSIFSFQGADFQSFSHVIQTIRETIEGSGYPFSHVPLIQSFRSSSVLLEATDRLLSLDELRHSTSAQAGFSSPPHRAFHHSLHGILELWPVMIPHADEEENIPWIPQKNTITPEHVKNTLALFIAEKIDNWLESKEPLTPSGRAIRPDDILILVRQRTTLMDTLIGALRKKSIPVSGADRLTLWDHLAIQDLLCLTRFALTPEDDFSLAQVLKSPLFPWKQAYSREEFLWTASENLKERSLWSYLQECQELCEGIAFLKTAHAMAYEKPAFEFYAQLLSHGGRERLLTRLGPDAQEPLEEWLNLTLTQTQDQSVGGFLDWAQNHSIDIKRDLDQCSGKARVMTVHGSKGLEANIVILADCADPPSQRHHPHLVFSQDGIPIWRLKAEHHHEHTQSLRKDHASALLEERHRLLYVAMTRARHRLYLTGHAPKLPLHPESWYALVQRSVHGEESLCGGSQAHPKA